MCCVTDEWMNAIACRDGPRAGPGQYRVHAEFVPAYIRNKPTAAMRSASKRESFLTGS